MKKTLLFFLLLFTSLFYAQVSDIEHCFGNTSFNLTTQKALLIGNLNPAETTVSYHLSLADANNNLNAIANPANYTSTESSKTIYARIDNLGTITTNFFNLKIYEQIQFLPLITPIRCKGQNDAVVTVAPSGGKTPYAYSLDGGPFTVYIGNPVGTFTNLSPGTHTIAIKDALGCSSMVQVFQIVEPVALTAKLYVENQTVVIDASGGTSPYQYSIDGTNYQTSYVFPNVSFGGPYTFRVKDALGCITSETATIYPPLAVGTQILKPIDCIDKASVKVFAAGGKAPYVYAVNKGSYQIMDVFSNLAAGDYVFEAKDAQNTVRYANVTIAEFLPFSMTITKTDATTDADNDGAITVTAAGGIKPYTYTLTDNANNPIRTQQASNVFSGLKSGIYGIKVNDAGNCIGLQTNISILKKTIPLAAIANISPITCTISTGTITVNVLGGKAPYKYAIGNGNNFVASNVFEGLAVGIYTLKVQDAENNEVILNAEIPPVNNPSVSVTTFSNVRCKGDNTGSVTVEATGGKAPYMYAIDGVLFSSSSTFGNLRTGTYNLTVKDVNNCTAITSIHITEPAEELSGTAFPVDTQGIIVNGHGGTAPYLYSLQNKTGVVIAGPKEDGVFLRLPPGLYTAQITDVYGCGYMQGPITVVKAPPLAATAEVVAATCGSLGKITITATGGLAPYSYSINNGTAVNSNVFPNLVPGNYTITVKDSENTTRTFVAAIIIKKIAINATLVTAVSCNGAKNGSIKTMVTDGQGPYVYSINNVVVYGTTTEQTFNNLVAGNYIIQVTDKNNCTYDIKIAVPEPTILNATVVVNDKNISVNAAGGTPPYRYTLQDHYTGATIRNTQLSNTFDNLPTGVYSVQVVDSNECSVLKTGNTVSESAALSVSFSISPVSCNNSWRSLTLVATGGSGTYQYSLDNGLNYTTSNIFNNPTAGSYLLKVRDSQGNTATVTAVVPPVNPLAASVVLTKDIDCAGGASINVTASGGTQPYVYSIDNGLTYTSIPVFNNLGAGTYFVSVKDSNTCNIITNTIILEQPAPLTFSTNRTNTSAVNANDGSITVLVNSGTAPFTYSLLNSNNVPLINAQSSNTFVNLGAGTYNVRVTDAKSCSSIQTQVTIVSPTTALSAVATVIQPNCLNPTGIITVTATAGTVPYQYSIDNGVTYGHSNTFTVLPGSYVIKVRDAQSALYTFTTTIVAPNPLHLTAIITSSVSCVSNGAIMVNTIGGQAPYTYSINGSPYQTSNNFSNLNAGVYTITVRDSNECTATTTLMLEAPIPIAVSATVDNQNIAVTATGGTPPYQYSLDLNTFQSSNTFRVFNYGTYQVAARDVMGCIALIHLTIDPPAPLIGGKKTITVDFKTGQTLGDLVIEGQDIKWYSSKGTSTGKTSKTSETPLPLTTVLVDGVTYYASQTIDGIESTERLAVTAKVDGSLATPDFVLPDFRFYPNPVQHTLSVNNTAPIDTVEILSVSGKSVLTKRINQTHSEIDLSHLASGLYFLKVKAEGQTKTIKILKQ